MDQKPKVRVFVRIVLWSLGGGVLAGALGGLVALLVLGLQGYHKNAATGNIGDAVAIFISVVGSALGGLVIGAVGGWWKITIKDDKARSSGKRLAKNLLLIVFSTGWVVALAGVLIIPAEILRSEFEFESTRLGNKEYHARVTSEHSSASQKEKVAAQRTYDFVEGSQFRLNRLVNHRQRLIEFQISVVVLCVWLGSVVAYWSWKLNRSLAARSPS